MPSVKQKSSKYHFYQFMPNGLFYLHSSDRSISTIKHVWFVFVMTMFYRNSYVFNANSVDPDQMPHSAASDLGLHGLLMFLLWNARLKWVVFGLTAGDQTQNLPLTKVDMLPTEAPCQFKSIL